jgi:erythromycin esterase
MQMVIGWSATLIRLAFLAWLLSGATIPARANDLAAARKEIEVLYARLDAALLQAQSALEGVVTPDFRMTDVTGEERDLDQLKLLGERSRAAYKTLMSRTAVQSVAMDDDTMRAVVSLVQEITSKQSTDKYRYEETLHDSWVKIGAEWRLRRSVTVHSRTWVNDHLTADVTARLPPEFKKREKIISEVRSRAVPLRTVRAGAGFDDLTALDKLIGDARIVALGEATHGASEFFRIKHRLFEYLVEKKGFTVLAFEDSWPDVEAVDRFIRTGEAGAANALEAMRHWVWRTREVRDLIEWMRSYNAGVPSGGKMLSFTGFDMQDPGMAAECVISALSRIAPSEAKAFQHYYAGVEDMYRRMFDVEPLLTSEERTKLRVNVKMALALLEARREALLQRMSLAEYRRVRQCARVVVQGSLPGVSVEAEVANARDRAIADNIKWLAEEVFPDEKIVLWAHNAHVAAASYARDFLPMGQHLRDTFGDKLRTLGFAFDRGEVLAIPIKNGVVDRSGPIAIKVPPAKPNSADALPSATGLPLFVLICAHCLLPVHYVAGSLSPS